MVIMALFQCLWVWKGTTGGSERDCSPDLEGGHIASNVVGDLESVGRAAGTPRFQTNKVLLWWKLRLLLVFMALFQCLWVWKGTTGGSETDYRP